MVSTIMSTDHHLEKTHVWIIDDDPGILEVTEIVLQEEGYATTTIQNESELDLRLEKKIVPHLILLDVLMSGTDGRDIAKKLKSLNSTKDIPIVMMSADTKIEEKVKEAGVNDYIKKPFDIEELIKKVYQYTKKAA